MKTGVKRAPARKPANKKVPKLLVLGAAGQVGQEFAKLALAGLADVTEVNHCDADVCDLKALRAIAGGADFDALVNLAAFHNTDACEGDPVKAFTVNAAGAENAARVAAELGKKAVYFSSDYVFGRSLPADPSGYTEDDPADPLNVYGASKAAGEAMLRLWCPDHLIIRTSSLFGTSTSRKGWTFPEMVCMKMSAGTPMKVVCDQIMAPTYTKDLAERTLALIAAGERGIFHVAGGGACSWHEFACAARDIAGLKGVIEPVSSASFGARAPRPGFSALKSARLSGTAGMRHWRKALEAYFREKEKTQWN